MHTPPLTSHCSPVSVTHISLLLLDCCVVLCCVRETRELERQLRVLQRSSGGSEKAIFALRKTIRHHYRQVIYLDLAFAAENEVEQVTHDNTQHPAPHLKLFHVTHSPVTVY